MRVAVVHDWLTVYGGAERVLHEILELYPRADLYSLVDFVPDHERGFLKGRPVRTSFIQNLPWARDRYRHYLPLMPLAIEQFDLSAYDLVISSSYAVAKGIITGPDQVHVSYVHSPMRYAWDLMHEYLAEARLEHGPRSWAVRYLLHWLRIWDSRTANGVDGFVANSAYVARRIRKAYGREAQVIYPPVDVGRFALTTEKADFYLTVSRLVPYKRVDLLVEAFGKLPDRLLVVIGDGPELGSLRRMAPANVELRGYEPNDTVRRLMQSARAFVFAAEEDFGIAVLEAQACGTPAIIYGKGGGLETVRGLETTDPTGVFFAAREPDRIAESIQVFEAAAHRIRPIACRNNAARFSVERFREEFAQYVSERLDEFGQQPHSPARFHLVKAAS